MEILTDMFAKIMETEKIPDEWSSMLIPIFKNKGNIQEYGNYWEIKLTSHTLKIWEQIIKKRLREKVLILDQQFGLLWPSSYELQLSLNRLRVLILVKVISEQQEGHLVQKMLTAPAKSQLTIGCHPSPMKTGSV